MARLQWEEKDHQSGHRWLKKSKMACHLTLALPSFAISTPLSNTTLRSTSSTQFDGLSKHVNYIVEHYVMYYKVVP